MAKCLESTDYHTWWSHSDF